MKYFNNFDEMYNNNVGINSKTVFNDRGNYITKMGKTYEVALNGIPFVRINFDDADPIIFFSGSELNDLGYTNEDILDLQSFIYNAFDSFCKMNGYEVDEEESEYYAGYPLKAGLSNKDGRNFAGIVKDIIATFEYETGNAEKELTYKQPYHTDFVRDKYRNVYL